MKITINEAERQDDPLIGDLEHGDLFIRLSDREVCMKCHSAYDVCKNVTTEGDREQEYFVCVNLRLGFIIYQGADSPIKVITGKLECIE